MSCSARRARVWPAICRPGSSCSLQFLFSFIVIAGTGYLLGITQSKEYARPEWYADLWLTVVWVVYFLVFVVRWRGARSRIFYVANCSISPSSSPSPFLHLGNNAAIPISLFSPKSYIVWAGVQDAMVQCGTAI